MDSTALLLVDVQYDFLDGGALQVPGSLEIIEPILSISADFQHLIASQDWHPAGHASFASSHPGQEPYSRIEWKGHYETLWPDHCIQHSKGAELHTSICQLPFKAIIQKGTHIDIDSYSAFFDNHHRAETLLHQHLQAHKISTLYISGLATDYCIKHTVLDAILLGYKVVLLTNTIKAVNLNPKDGEEAISQMQLAGATIL